MMRRRFSIFYSTVARRIFTLFIICALVPICALAFLSMRKVSAGIREDSFGRLRYAGKNIGMTIHEGLSLLQSEMETLPLSARKGSHGNSSRTSHWNHVSQEKRLQALTICKKGTEAKAVFGAPISFPPLSPAARDHLEAGKSLLFLAPARARNTKDSIFIATAMNRSLPRNGLLVGEIDADYLWTLVRCALPPGMDVCILDSSGRPMYGSLPLTPELIARLTEKLSDSSIGHFGWSRENEDYLISYWSVYLKPAFLANSWTVVTFQPRQDSLKAAHSFVKTFLLVICLTLFVVVFVSSIQIRRSLIPLSVLKEGAHKISGGDFDYRVKIDSGDEFQDLAISFNSMSEHLGRQFTRLSEMKDQLNQLNWGIIEALANAIDAKSPWTAGHSQRVTRLALEIGREMGFSESELELLHWGGLFHDVGKIGVPETILDKSGRLTAEEQSIVRSHPEKGEEILRPIQAYHKAIPIVAQHHEWFDGQGYPSGLAGEEISLGARILAVADVFDALFSPRPYRDGWEIGKVISYIEENAGSQFDPEVVKVFLRIKGLECGGSSYENIQPGHDRIGADGR